MCKNRRLLPLAVGLSAPPHLEAKNKEGQSALTNWLAHALTLNEYRPPALDFPDAARAVCFDGH